MISTRVIPCLLIQDGALVKTVQFSNPAYIGDPVNAVRIFNELEVDELIFLDISATPRGRQPMFKLVEDIASECFMPITYGGGVSKVEDIRRLIRGGIEKVAINTKAQHSPEFIREAAGMFGSQSIVSALDVRRTGTQLGTVWVNGGQLDTGINPVIAAKKMEEAGAGELLINSMNRDGTWEGYDLELLEQVCKNVDIPVIACGGAGIVDDLSKAVHLAGAAAVAVGSMVVFQAKGHGVLINFPERADLDSAIN